MLTSRFGATWRNSKWSQHVHSFQGPRTLLPDEPIFTGVVEGPGGITRLTADSRGAGSAPCRRAPNDAQSYRIAQCQSGRLHRREKPAFQEGKRERAQGHDRVVERVG